MEVIIRPNVKQVIDLTARLICDSVKKKPESVLGLATVSTSSLLSCNANKSSDSN